MARACWVLLLVSLAGAARGQFGTAAFPRAEPAGDGTVMLRRKMATTAAFYPGALFRSAGLFANGRAGTRDDLGALVAVELGWPGRPDTAIGVGGWYWGSGPRDLYEIHARVMTSRGIGDLGARREGQGEGGDRRLSLNSGLQVGYIQSTRSVADALTTFLVVQLSCRRSPAAGPQRGGREWAVDLGIGGLTDFTGGRRSTDFTAYVQASLEIADNLRLLATEWYLRDRYLDLNRLAVGVGYFF